jgi:hypothetical protein
MAQHGPVRIVRLMIASLVGVTVVPLAAAPASAASRSITVAPTHGPSGAPFTVEYREPASGLILVSCSADPVTVTFDGGTLGRAPLRQQGTECVASLSAAPGARPGRHAIGVSGTSVSTTYTVDPAPSPTVRTTVPASPTAKASASPSATPSATPAASTAAADPLSPDGSGRGSPGRSAITMPGPNGSGGSSATPWVLAGGALLIVGDLALLALLSVRTRRRPRRGQPSTG